MGRLLIQIVSSIFNKLKGEKSYGKKRRAPYWEKKKIRGRPQEN